MKRIALLILALFFSPFSRAHDVIWYENPFGFPFEPPLSEPPALNLEIDPAHVFFGDPPYEEVHIVPDFNFLSLLPFFEPCTVYVNIDPPVNPLLGVDLVANAGIPTLPTLLFGPISDSTGIHAQIPALEYDVIVYLREFPTNNQPIHTSITGEWHASGLPPNNNCNAVTPNQFEVPVDITFSPLWSILHNAADGTVTIDTKTDGFLQTADSPNGTYTTVGQGHLFSFVADSVSQFFRKIKRTAGGVLGTIKDSSGKVQPNIKVGLAQGGANAISDANGNYLLNLLAWGLNRIQLIKTDLLTDPVTGNLGTNLSTIEIDIPILKPYGTLNFKVEMQSFVIPVCNCTPWCSIGFASLDGSTTPIYFSGGANPPKGGPASCGPVEVTVTRPDGSTFQLKPGTGRHQNSGANPIVGTWKVTTKVCGQEKTCQISYP